MDKHVLSYANPENRPKPLTLGGIVLLATNVLATVGAAALMLTSLPSLHDDEAAAMSRDIGLLLMPAALVLFVVSLVYLDEHEGRVRPGWLNAAVWTAALSVALAILNLVCATSFH